MYMTTKNLTLATVLKNSIFIPKYDEKPRTMENQVEAMVIHLHFIPAINHLILGIFQNLKLDWNIDFSSYISLVYLKCKRDHSNSQNCVSHIYIKEFLNTHGIYVLDFQEAPKFIRLSF